MLNIADEVTVIVLLRVFTEKPLTVHWIDHQTEDFSAYDIVMDIGRAYDGLKFFDHHQNNFSNR